MSPAGIHHALTSISLTRALSCLATTVALLTGCGPAPGEEDLGLDDEMGCVDVAAAYVEQCTPGWTVWDDGVTPVTPESVCQVGEAPCIEECIRWWGCDAGATASDDCLAGCGLDG